MVFLSLAAPRKLVAHEFLNLVEEFGSFCEALGLAHVKAVTSELEKLQELDAPVKADNPELPDIGGIQTRVGYAAACYHSVHWFPLYLVAIEGRHRLQAAIAAGFVLVIMGFSVLISPAPPLANLSGFDFIYAVVMAVVLARIGASIHSRIPSKYVARAIAIEAAACLVAVHKFSSWSTYAPPVWRQVISPLSPVHGTLRVQMESVPIAHILEVAIWLIAVFLYHSVFLSPYCLLRQEVHEPRGSAGARLGGSAARPETQSTNGAMFGGNNQAA
jgi:hypothetical protein